MATPDAALNLGKGGSSRVASDHTVRPPENPHRTAQPTGPRRPQPADLARRGAEVRHQHHRRAAVVTDVRAIPTKARRRSRRSAILFPQPVGGDLADLCGWVVERLAHHVRVPVGVLAPPQQGQDCQPPHGGVRVLADGLSEKRHDSSGDGGTETSFAEYAHRVPADDDVWRGQPADRFVHLVDSDVAIPPSIERYLRNVACHCRVVPRQASAVSCRSNLGPGLRQATRRRSGPSRLRSPNIRLVLDGKLRQRLDTEPFSS